MTLEIAVAAILLVSLILYLVLGGADFGAGILQIVVSEPKAQQKKELMRQAIAPIWEANHVWLILIVVILFTAFAPAFAFVSTLLHVPLTIMLFGVVIRGSAFVFRQYDPIRANTRRWDFLFQVSSVVTPFCLGLTLGAITAGKFPNQTPTHVSDFFLPWLTPFCFSVGVFTCLLCALLAAVYLTFESKDESISDYFRTLALRLLIALVIFGAAVLALGQMDFFFTLQGALVLTAATLFAFATAYALSRKKIFLARVVAPLMVASIVLGWGLEQLPFLVRPFFTVQNSAASEATLTWLLWALAVGSLFLLPSLYFLFRIFKKSPSDL